MHRPTSDRIGKHGLRIAIPLAVVSLFLALAAVACGGSASPGVATVPPTATPTVSPSSSSSTSAASQASSATPATSLTPNPVAFSTCMRSNGGVQFEVPPSIDQSSTQFANAVLTCQKLIPAGLPYSGTN